MANLTVVASPSAGGGWWRHYADRRPDPYPASSVFALRCTICGATLRYEPIDPVIGYCEHTTGKPAYTAHSENHWFETPEQATEEGF